MGKMSTRKMALQSFVVLAILFVASEGTVVSATSSRGDASSVQTVLGDGKIQCQFSNGETQVYVKDVTAVDGLQRRDSFGGYAPKEGYSAGHADNSQPFIDAGVGSPAAPMSGSTPVGYGDEGSDGTTAGSVGSPPPANNYGSGMGQPPHSAPAHPSADKKPPPCCEELHQGAGGWTMLPPSSTSPNPSVTPSGVKPPEDDGKTTGSESGHSGSVPSNPDSYAPKDNSSLSPKSHGHKHHSSDSRGAGDMITSSQPKDTPVPDESGSNDIDGGSGDVKENGPLSDDKECDEDNTVPSPPPLEDSPPAPVPAENESTSPYQDSGSIPKIGHKHHKHHPHADPSPPTSAVDVPEDRTSPESSGYADAKDCSKDEGETSCSNSSDLSPPEEDSNPMCGPAVPYSDLVHLFVPSSNNATSSSPSLSITSGGGSIPDSSPEATVPADKQSSAPPPGGITSGGGSVSAATDKSSHVADGVTSGEGYVPASGGVPANGLSPAPPATETDEDDHSADDITPEVAPKTRIGITSGRGGVPTSGSDSSPDEVAPAITSGSGEPKSPASADDCNDTCPANSVSTFEFKTCEFIALVQRMQLSAAQLSVFDSGLKAMLDNSLASYSVDTSGKAEIAATTDSGNPSVKGAYLNGAINDSISQAMGDLKPTLDSPLQPAADSKSSDSAARRSLLNAMAGHSVPPSSAIMKRTTSRLLKVVRRH